MVKQRHEAVADSHFHAKANSDIQRAQNIDAEADKVLKRYNQNILKRLFEAWFDHRCRKKFKKQQRDEFNDKMYFLRKRYMF